MDYFWYWSIHTRSPYSGLLFMSYVYTNLYSPLFYQSNPVRQAIGNFLVPFFTTPINPIPCLSSNSFFLTKKSGCLKKQSIPFLKPWIFISKNTFVTYGIQVLSSYVGFFTIPPSSQTSTGSLIQHSCQHSSEFFSHYQYF